mgnify:FL=1|tara:strand:+ start:2798 stop:3805 length:1008 start_codon:yes stop_codon:yes gene_type:complete
MAAIRLRSPRYRDSVCTSAHLSVQMTIKINTVLRYTIIKDSVASQKNLFEYSELCRDYIDITWTGSYSGYSPQTGLVILTDIKYFAGANGTGSEVTSNVTGGGQITQNGFDSYSNFVEGYNKTIANNETLLSNYTQTTGGVKTYTVYAPKSIAGTLPYLNSTGTQILYSSYGTSSVTHTLPNNQLINIERYGCNKYDVVYIDFVNKYGAIQREYFTLKSVKKIKAKREDFKSNIISSTGSYSINEHTIQNFNIEGSEEMIVNSDYLPEYYNEVFTELLLSDQVWVYMKSFSTNSFTAIPINITSSDLTYKTQVNDRLINFTFSFKMSYDYINNIR